MNRMQCFDWLAATAACLPQFRLGDLRDRLERLGTPENGEVWEGGISAAGGFSQMAVRYRGKDCSYRDFSKRVVAAFGQTGVDFPKEPAAGFPWLSLVWDGAAGRWSSLTLLGTACDGAEGSLCRLGGKMEKVRFRRALFRPRDFGDAALERSLGEFSAICPVASIVRTQGSGTQWSLSLERGVSLPDFLRCDLSRAFTPNSAQLSFLLRDCRLTELAFDGEALWAYWAA